MLSLSGKVARSADRGHVREFYTISVYIKISLFGLIRHALRATFPAREGKGRYGIDAMTGSFSVMLSVSETSPGKAKPTDLILLQFTAI